MRTTSRGFTLIELAIVMVIIGLVLGAILVGRDLIQSSTLQSVISDQDEYKAAVHTFRLKYGSYPGDISNATTLWSECIDWSGGVNRCNGNGDGIWTAPLNGEALRAWQHLKLAGLIKDEISNDTSAFIARSSVIIPSWSSASAIRVPYTPFKGSAGYNFATDALSYDADICTCNGASNTLYGRNGKRLFIGSKVGRNTGIECHYNDCGAVPPRDAYDIDKKIDDGLAYKGEVVVTSGRDSGVWGPTADCGPPIMWVATADLTPSFDFTNNDADCVVFFYLD